MVKNLKEFLDSKATLYNHPSFINDDPVSIPHRFTKKQDIEIAGFFAAILAWGNRKSIINSCSKLLGLMDHSPYDFIMDNNWDNNPAIAEMLKGFVHRTFNDMDLWYLLNFLRHHYYTRGEKSLETAFSRWMHPTDETIEKGLCGFHNYVFSYVEEAREEVHCRKHIATPLRKSACKRLNMFLRWMVRADNNGVDFGIWKEISPAQLICPMDVHVTRVAKKLNLLNATQKKSATVDWQLALDLTSYLRSLDKNDPVKYDFALFGLGIVEQY
jgi:uncharacterized protein (TIGR02757 family)